MEVGARSKDKNWAILNKDPSWVPGASRKAAVAHFRLLTGRDCLRLHLYRIGISNSPNCSVRPRLTRGMRSIKVERNMKQRYKRGYPIM
ncbi:hypothetical protein TNCV_1597691 [Trichonephila clavipes]|nr:hypothetical protein TNCV_1597691 [Trichonephila clavipes]